MTRAIERAAVRWQTSDELGQLGAHHRLAAVRIGLCADCGDRALAVVKLLLRDAVEPGEKRIGRWRLWEAHRRSEAKRGRESRHQSMINRFERIARLRVRDGEKQRYPTARLTPGPPQGQGKCGSARSILASKAAGPLLGSPTTDMVQ